MGMIKPFYESNYAVRNAARLVLGREESIGLFEYSSPLGTKRQINAARKWLHRIGVSTGEENVLLSAGAQNALSVMLISLFKAGDKIADGILELASGVWGTLHLNGDGITQDEGGITLCGDQGHLLLPCPNHMGGEVRLVLESPAWDRPGEQRILTDEFCFHDNARGMGAADLVFAIRHNTQPRISKELAYHVLEVFDALYQSSQSGAWVEIQSLFEKPRPMPSIYNVEKETACFV